MNSNLMSQMASMKAAHLRTTPANYMSNDLSMKRSHGDAFSADARLKQKKIKAKRDEVLRQMASSSGASQQSSTSSRTTNSSLSTSSSLNANFSTLAKIIDHMKQKHQEGNNFPINLLEIEEEVREKHPNFYITQKQRIWLEREALPNNSKMEVVEGDKYQYKPKYTLKNRKQLLKLLQKTDINGGGGILFEDIEESMPANKAKSTIAALEDSVVSINKSDRKQVLFFNDKSCDLNIDEDLQKLWNSVQVTGMDEGKIEDYLQKHDIVSMQDVGIKKLTNDKAKKKPIKKKRIWNQKIYNTHLSDVLQDYSDRDGPGGAKT